MEAEGGLTLSEVEAEGALTLAEVDEVEEDLATVMRRGALVGTRECLDAHRINEESLAELAGAIVKAEMDGPEAASCELIETATLLLECRRCFVTGEEPDYEGLERALSEARAEANSKRACRSRGAFVSGAAPWATQSVEALEAMRRQITRGLVELTEADPPPSTLEAREEVRLFQAVSANAKALCVLKAALASVPPRGSNEETATRLEAAVAAAASLAGDTPPSPEARLLTATALACAACAGPTFVVASEPEIVAEARDARDRLAVFRRTVAPTEAWAVNAQAALDAFVVDALARQAAADLYSALEAGPLTGEPGAVSLVPGATSLLRAAIDLFDAAQADASGDASIVPAIARGAALARLARAALDLAEFDGPDAVVDARALCTELAASWSEETRVFDDNVQSEQSEQSSPTEDDECVDAVVSMTAQKRHETKDDPVVRAAARRLADGAVTLAERDLHLRRMREQRDRDVTAAAARISGAPGALVLPGQAAGVALGCAAAEAAAWAPVLATPEARALARAAVFAYGLRAAAADGRWASVASFLALGGRALQEYVLPFENADQEQPELRAVRVADQERAGASTDVASPWYRVRLTPDAAYCAGLVEADNTLQAESLISMHRALGLPDALEDELRLLAAAANDAAVARVLAAGLGWFSDQSLFSDTTSANERVMREAFRSGARALDLGLAAADRPLLGPWSRPAETRALVAVARAFRALRVCRGAGAWGDLQHGPVPATLQAGDDVSEPKDVPAAVAAARRLEALLDDVTTVSDASIPRRELDAVEAEFRSRLLVARLADALSSGRVLTLDEAVAAVPRVLDDPSVSALADLDTVQTLASLCLAARRLAWAVAPDADAGADDFDVVVRSLIADLETETGRFLAVTPRFAYGLRPGRSNLPLNAVVQAAVDALVAKANLATDSWTVATGIQAAVALEPTQPGAIRDAILRADTFATNLSPDVLAFLDQARRFVAVQDQLHNTTILPHPSDNCGGGGDDLSPPPPRGEYSHSPATAVADSPTTGVQPVTYVTASF